MGCDYECGFVLNYCLLSAYKINRVIKITDNNIEKYEHAGKQLLTQNQLALLLSIEHCILQGMDIFHIVERIHSFEADMGRRNLWHSAKTDLAKGVPFHKVLVQTGFFNSQIETIFLAVQDPQYAVKASIQLLHLAYN